MPDLAEDLGTKSADGLTWTFKLKQGIKYSDGSAVKAEDYAYAIKRSFAHDLYDSGPTYQIQFFKDGDKYKGPYAAGGANYSGVETPDDDTLVIHLAKKFDDLPFYARVPDVHADPAEGRHQEELRAEAAGDRSVHGRSRTTPVRRSTW